MFPTRVLLFLSSAALLLHLVHCLNVPISASGLNGSLPACQPADYKYDFTECDSFGGRWRVSVPVAPNKCSSSSTSSSTPIIPGPLRVNRCYSACESGQYFNTSSLLCVGCPAGHYSLGGGVLFESFNQSTDGSGGGLPDGFNIRTESNLHTPEMDKLCSGWYVEPSTGQLVSSMTTTDDPSSSSSSSSSTTTTTIPSSLTCISVLTYTVKVVKSGRLRFEYRYRIPADLSTLLFSFHYRLYANGGIFEGDGPGGQLARRYPMPTVEQQSFEVNEVTFDRPGLYVFTWRSVSVGHPRRAGRFEQLNAQNNNNNNNLFKESSSAFFSLGFIRLRRILVEGIAYASECTPCPPGTYAPTIRSRTCSACPPNTANEGAGAAVCARCDPATEYAPRGSVRCRKRPQCGLNDFYTVPVGVCNATTRQQKVQYRWIEPRICIDSKGVFPKEGEGLVNCTSSTTESSSSSSTSCDLGMDLQEDPKAPPSSSGNHSSRTKFCQFCPEGSYRGDYSSPACTPCPPFTSPYYALSVFRWNSSLPSWSASSLEEQEEYFAESSRYLNAYFSRLCIHTDEEDNSGGGGNDAMDVSKQTEEAGEDQSSNSRVEECDSRNTWQPYADHIRTGASSMLDSYLIFSVAVPGFRSNAGGELSFVFETFCDAGDSCVLMFVETRADEGELADLVSRQLTKSSSAFVKTSTSDSSSSSAISRSKYLFLHSSNHVLKEWYQSTEGGRLSYRHRIEGGGGGGNVSGANLIYSWVFKRSTSFQSYAKVYSLLLTNSMAGSAVQCKSCPAMSSTALASSSSSSSSSNQCVTCPEGQYLEDGEEEDGQVVKDGHLGTVVRSESISSSHPQCRHCPENYVVNQSLALPIGRRSSCLPCGPGLRTAEIKDQQQNSKPVCFSNCSVAFADGDRYELGELGSELEYRGGSMFTAGGTQFLHLFRIGLCGHPKTAKLVTCQNNITDMYEQQQDKDQTSTSSGGGIRAFICRSTIIPDSPGVIYTTQSFSLGDELIAITREPVFDNISVHADFIQSNNQQQQQQKDYHLFYRTRSVTTGACPQGRRMTVTMRCSNGSGGKTNGKKDSSSSSTAISTPRSCPAGTCDGCTFHLLIETATAAACRLCRPFSGEDFDTVVGECVDGLQQVHYINPRGCVVLPDNKASSSSVLTRPCTVLLPRHIQIAISVVIALGLLLLLLVFHFWNQNRSLEYKYSKLIEHSNKNGEDGDDEEGDLSFDNCCAEMDGGEEEEEDQKTKGNQLEQNNNNNNRLDKNKSLLLGSSQEMQTLFGSPSSQTKKALNQQRRLDEEGYETIHLTPASATTVNSAASTPNQIV